MWIVYIDEEEDLFCLEVFVVDLLLKNLQVLMKAFEDDEDADANEVPFLDYCCCR